MPTNHRRNRNAKDRETTEKPRPDFPLFTHRNGQWCKKIRGKQHYFGVWSNPGAALEEYLRTKDDLQAGRTPTPAGGVVTLADVINEYLTDAEKRCEAGELSPLSFRDYRWTGEQIVAHFGRTVDPEKLRPTDFAAFRHKLAAKYVPGRLAKTVTGCRMIFRSAYESEITEMLPRFGSGFKAASNRAARAAKAAAGGKLFTADEVRRMLDDADESFRTAILLAINGGFGNTDLSLLPLDAVDLNGPLINYSRSKTGVNRRIPLWPETVAASTETITIRPEPQSGELSDRVFLTSRGGELVTLMEDGRRVDKLTIRFRNLLKTIDAVQKGRASTRCVTPFKRSVMTPATRWRRPTSLDMSTPQQPETTASVSVTSGCGR